MIKENQSLSFIRQFISLDFDIFKTNACLSNRKSNYEEKFTFRMMS